MIDEGKPRNCDPANCDKKVIDLPIPRLGALPLCACIGYVISKDYKMAVYWLSAGILNICVTF